jgi:hypothetical protein
MTKALIAEIFPGKPAIITGFSLWSQRLSAIIWARTRALLLARERRAFQMNSAAPGNRTSQQDLSTT